MGLRAAGDPAAHRQPRGSTAGQACRGLRHRRGVAHDSGADHRAAVHGGVVAPACRAWRPHLVRGVRRRGAADRPDPVARTARHGVRRADPDRQLFLAAGNRHQPQPAPGRPRFPLRPADPRHRPAGDPLRPLLPLRTGADGAFLRFPAAVHGLHARRGARGKSLADDALLGADQPVLVPAHRLLGQPFRRPQGCEDGPDRYRRGRPGAAGRGAAARPHRRQLRTHRGPRGWRADPRPRSVSAGADTDPARRVHQVGAVSLPFLAAPRDGGADPGFRVPALGDHGQGRRIPAGPAVSGAGRHRVVLLPGQPERPGDAVAGGRHGTVPA